jgi:hypothetical protein
LPALQSAREAGRRLALGKGLRRLFRASLASYPGSFCVAPLRCGRNVMGWPGSEDCSAPPVLSFLAALPGRCFRLERFAGSGLHPLESTALSRYYTAQLPRLGRAEVPPVSAAALMPSAGMFDRPASDREARSRMGTVMNLPRREFLHLAVGAAALPAAPWILRAQPIRRGRYV